MSGHSKWSSIKYKKSVIDVKKGKIFTKIAKEIIIAVKIAGSDSSSNPRLRNAIISAKAVNMPNNNVDRAIKKGNKDMEKNDYEELSYEGYAVEGVAVVVDCLSDNRNRTASEIRSIFAKNKGNLGVTGAVSWMFHRKSQFIIEDINDEEQLIDIVIDVGAEEINIDNTNAEIIGSVDAFENIQKALDEAGIKIITAHHTKLSKNIINLTEVTKVKQVLRLIEALEDSDDVQKVYANFDINPSILDNVMEL